jgi:hypothetical protein
VHSSNKQTFIYLVERCQVTRNVTSADYLELNISVLFPRTAVDTYLDNFITYLPGYTQTFGNLMDHVYFKNLLIEGAWRDVLSTVSDNTLFYVIQCQLSIRLWQGPEYL